MCSTVAVVILFTLGLLISLNILVKIKMFWCAFSSACLTKQSSIKGCCSHSKILLWYRSRVFIHLVPTTKGAFSAARHERAEEDVPTAGTLCSTNWRTGKSHCGCWQSIRRQLLQYLEEAVSSLLSKVRLGDPTHSELVDYLPEGVGEDADMPQLMVQIFN